MRNWSLSLLFLVVLSLSGTAQRNMSLLGRLQYDEELSDVWGWSNGKSEYALVGLNNGFSVVDISDPGTPTEVFFQPGPGTSWRDIKTWKGYAYITNESSEGLLIVDLNSLPENPNLDTATYTGDEFSFQRAHNLYIDENGICYIFGANHALGGVIVLDLNQDPMNPVELGRFNGFNLHDGVARGDTLWGFAIDNGNVAVLDVSDKANLELIGSFPSPGKAAHNGWFSDDNRYIFTTDEMDNGVVAAYDMSDLGNPKELDRYRSNPGSNSVPHNVHYHEGFLVTSYYKDGITLVDASRPRNLIETGFYDTSPEASGGGTSGCWGAYPFLPSGLVLATDIANGLFVFRPHYIKGCYLEGTIRSGDDCSTVLRPRIQILSTDVAKTGELNGTYAVGFHQAGTYSVLVEADGYISKTVDNVVLENGVLTNLNVRLDPVDGTSGDNGLALLRSYPNPFREQFTLEVRCSDYFETVKELRVINYQGKVVEEGIWPANELTFQLGGAWGTGLFYLEVRSEGEVIGEMKLIKEY